MIILSLLILFSWFIGFFIFSRFRHMEGIMPLENPSVLFVLFLIIYSTFPPLLWTLQGGEYISGLSGRLYQYQPTLQEQTYLTFLGLLIIIGILLAQLIFHQNNNFIRSEIIKPIPKTIVFVCAIIIFSQYIFVSTLKFSGVISTSTSYIESYAVIQALPLFLKQIIKIISGLAFFSKLVLLVWLFQNWRTHKFMLYAFVIFLIISFDIEGGRASLFITLFTILILRNRYVKEIKPSQFIFLLFTGIISFLAFGALRTYSDFSFLSIGEFDSLWANAIELKRDSDLGNIAVPINVLFSETVGPIPSFFLPFEKIDYSTWYLKEYYPEYGSAGGGLMFGILSQVVIGFGWSEAIIRGILTGLFLCFLTNYLKKGKGWWHYPSLIYLSVWSFNSVRDSSFALVTPLIQVVVFSVLFIRIVAGILKQVKNKSHD